MLSNKDILNARILIVDDNRINVTLLEKMLLSAGYTSTLSTTDSRETMELYQSYQPNIILLDINMPHQNGYQIMEQLKEVEKGDYIPILVITALHDNETRIKSLKSGAKDFLTKPFDRTESLTRIHNMLETSLLYSQVNNQNVILETKVQEKTRKLLQANRELEDFVYTISHDLKEPLFSISGFISRLSRVYKDALDGKGETFINRIKANLELMSQKIQNIMEVLEIGRNEYTFKTNNTKSIVNDVVASLESKAEAEGINIVNRNNLPTELFCDGEMLKDVFSNLISNSIKFMGDGTSPLIKENKEVVKQIEVGCKKNGKYYIFFVEDTGIGIREEYREQIFKIFKKLNDIEDDGTGIGLAKAKKIIEMHKGEIWVEGPVKDGRGSRFCFTIPIEKSVIDGNICKIEDLQRNSINE